MIKIYLYSTDSTSPGVNKIISHLNFELNVRGINSNIIYSLDKTNKNDIIIPYGIKAAYQLYHNGYNFGYCLMVDAYSVGWINKILFYFRKFKFSYYDLYYSIYQILKYSYQEFIVLKYYKKIMYVSPHDLFLIKRYFKKKEFILVPNGVDVSNESCSVSNIVNMKNEIILGTISNWNRTSICEVKWFIEDYFPQLRKQFPTLKILIAGIDKDLEAKKYFDSISGVKFIGKIDDKKEFFSKIDIFIATVPKGVGILNKILDAFAYRKLVIGLPECFYAFPNNIDGYISCRKLLDFERAIKLYLNNPNTINRIIDHSFNYIKNNNDWSKNYNVLVNDIIEFYEIKNENF